MLRRGGDIYKCLDLRVSYIFVIRSPNTLNRTVNKVNKGDAKHLGNMIHRRMLHGVLRKEMITDKEMCRLVTVI